jgi:hypothetical protein
MKKIRAFSRSPMGTTFMFMLAVLLLMTGTIGGVRATPQIFNPDFYYGGLELDEIGITLLENGEPVSSRNYNQGKQAFDVSSNNTSNTEQGILLANMLGNENLKIGYVYPERLSVQNTGVIPEYVRVTVYKYWIDGKGNRFRAFDKQGNDMMINNLIDLHFLEGNGWTIDTNAQTAERTVLYYHNVIAPGPENKVDFADTLRIDNRILDYGMKVPVSSANSKEMSWTWTWVADGLQFVIEAEADGVQNHNARAAVKSAWGLTDNDISRLKLNIPEE